MQLASNQKMWKSPISLRYAAVLKKNTWWERAPSKQWRMQIKRGGRRRMFEFWLLFYAHTRPTLGAAGHIIQPLANQLMVMGLNRKVAGSKPGLDSNHILMAQRANRAHWRRRRRRRRRRSVQERKLENVTLGMWNGCISLSVWKKCLTMFSSIPPLHHPPTHHIRTSVNAFVPACLAEWRCSEYLSVCNWNKPARCKLRVIL
jgi:hypothetical protein